MSVLVILWCVNLVFLLGYGWILNKFVFIFNWFFLVVNVKLYFFLFVFVFNLFIFFMLSDWWGSDKFVLCNCWLYWVFVFNWVIFKILGYLCNKWFVKIVILFVVVYELVLFLYFLGL